MALLQKDNSPFQGRRRTAWLDVTIGSGEDVVYIKTDEPMVIAAVAWDSAHDASTATLQLDPTEADDPATGDWRTLNLDGSDIQLSVVPGGITGLPYNEGFLLESAALKLDTSETAARNIKIMVWSTI